MIINPDDIADFKLIDICLSLIKHDIVAVSINGKTKSLFQMIVNATGHSKNTQYRRDRRTMFRAVTATDGTPYGYANPRNSQHVTFIERVSDLGLCYIIDRIDGVKAEGRYFRYNEMLSLMVRLQVAEALRVGVFAMKDAANALQGVVKAAHNFSDAMGKAMPDGLDEIRASITASRIERFIKHTGTYEDSTRVIIDTKSNIEGEL